MSTWGLAWLDSRMVCLVTSVRFRLAPLLSPIPIPITAAIVS